MVWRGLCVDSLIAALRQPIQLVMEALVVQAMRCVGRRGVACACRPCLAKADTPPDGVREACVTDSWWSLTSLACTCSCTKMTATRAVLWSSDLCSTTVLAPGTHERLRRASKLSCWTAVEFEGWPETRGRCLICFFVSTVMPPIQ